LSAVFFFMAQTNFRGIFDSFFSKDWLWGTPIDPEKTNSSISSELLPELELDMDDKELLDLSKKWTDRYQAYLKSANIVSNAKRNYNYWSAKYDETTRKGPTDNIIFEATETILPIITRENPEPTVYIENTPDGYDLSRDIRDMLMDVSDKEGLRIKLKDITRDWMMNYIGCVKIGWDGVEDRIAVRRIRPQKLILDPDGIIVNGKFTGEYVGEILEADASTVIARFKDHKEYIKSLVKDKMGTRVSYTEWWTKEYLFYTLGNKVLKKMRNPNWNYDNEE